MDTFFCLMRDFFRDRFLPDIVLIAVATFAILASMAVDLFFGIRKAKKNGIARTSAGLKKTCDKAIKYFCPFAVLVCVDLIVCVLLPVPVFSLAWAVWCVFCEFTSVREKAWKKKEIHEAGRLMRIVAEDKKDIARLVARLLSYTHHEPSSEQEETPPSGSED